MMKREHITPVQIRFYDIDLMGHVYNAQYQEFFDLARIISQSGLPEDLVSTLFVLHRLKSGRLH